MKFNLKKTTDLYQSFSLLKERTVQKTGEVLKAVIIPAEKATTGYWLGRLEDICESRNKSFLKQQKELVKQLGEQLPGKDGQASGGYKLKPENREKYDEAIEELLNVEEEISFCPLKWELIDGISWPSDFISALSSFVEEPKEK